MNFFQMRYDTKLTIFQQLKIVLTPQPKENCVYLSLHFIHYNFLLYRNACGDFGSLVILLHLLFIHSTHRIYQPTTHPHTHHSTIVLWRDFVLFIYFFPFITTLETFTRVWLIIKCDPWLSISACNAHI